MRGQMLILNFKCYDLSHSLQNELSSFRQKQVYFNLCYVWQINFFFESGSASVFVISTD